jgi:hypothetical protein
MLLLSIVMYGPEESAVGSLSQRWRTRVESQRHNYITFKEEKDKEQNTSIQGQICRGEFSRDDILTGINTLVAYAVHLTYRRGEPGRLLLLIFKYISQHLPHANFLPCVHCKLKSRRRLENEHDRAPEAEPAHLLPRS